MNREIPAITASTYMATALNLDPGQQAQGIGIGLPVADNWMQAQAEFDVGRQRRVQGVPLAALGMLNRPQSAPQQKEPTVTRRLVQVLIADPNENVPTADCLLYEGKPVLTDATDQELYFDIDIKSILAAHNEKRVKLIDKKIKDRTEHLEPAKVRDLKMVVVTIATF